jgi:hypothetical protein
VKVLGTGHGIVEDELLELELDDLLELLDELELLLELDLLLDELDEQSSTSKLNKVPLVL